MGQILQLAIKECMAREYFDIQKKTILGRDHRFFSAVLKEMGVVILIQG